MPWRSSLSWLWLACWRWSRSACWRRAAPDASNRPSRRCRARVAAAPMPDRRRSCATRGRYATGPAARHAERQRRARPGAHDRRGRNRRGRQRTRRRRAHAEADCTADHCRLARPRRVSRLLRAAGGEPGRCRGRGHGAAAAAARADVDCNADDARAASAANAGVVTLTFDAGADRGYAEDILDTLQTSTSSPASASPASGPSQSRPGPPHGRRRPPGLQPHPRPSLVHRRLGLAAAGCRRRARRAELDDADAIIAPLIGHSTQPLYRLPYGDDDAQVAADVAPAGYTRKVGWTVDSLGWRGAAASDIVARCLKLAAPGAVYVFHVGHASQDAHRPGPGHSRAAREGFRLSSASIAGLPLLRLTADPRHDAPAR